MMHLNSSKRFCLNGLPTNVRSINLLNNQNFDFIKTNDQPDFEYISAHVVTT